MASSEELQTPAEATPEERNENPIRDTLRAPPWFEVDDSEKDARDETGP